MKNQLFLLGNGEILNLAVVARVFEERRKFFVGFAGEKKNLQISRRDFFKIQGFCEFL